MSDQQHHQLQPDHSMMPTPLVLEDTVIERRVRRPADLARFALAVAIIVSAGFLAYFAQRTTSGIDQDITRGANRLPDALVFAANLVSGFGALILPALSTVDMVIRKRARQLIESFGALILAIIMLSVGSWLITKIGSERVLLAFSGTKDPETAVPFNIVLGGLSGYITVARIMSRARWNVSAIIIVASIALADIISGGITAAGLGLSIAVGWATGLLMRYLLGTETTRPPGSDIAETMYEIGHPLTLLRAAEVLDAGRRYDATTTDGERLDLVVLDRDLEGAGLGTAIYRSLRLRDDPGGAGTSMRRRLERTALNSWAISTAGINTPHLLSVAEVGPDAAVLAFEHVGGRRFSSIDHTIGDAELAGAWEVVRDLQAARIAHRALIANNLMLGQDGKVYVMGLEDGAIAASDVLLRIDIAEMLITLSIIAGPDRAVHVGRVMLGDYALSRALPALQLVALSQHTRSIVKGHKDLLGDLRSRLLAITATGESENFEIERIKPRTLLTIAAGTIAAYLLLTQLGSVDLIALVKNADMQWLIIGLTASVCTYAAATTSLMGVVPEKLSFWKTFQAQWAASFATLVAPPTLGSVAINVRYLSAAGLHSALAATSVAVAQVLAFLSHVGLLLVAVVVAGTSSDFAFRPSRTSIIIVAVLALAISIASSMPKVRQLVGARVKPIVSQVVPRMAALINQPGKLLAGFGGVIALNMSYIVCLFACVEAFGAQASIATIAVVYLAGSVVGQAAPTPGGLGAVEAALAAGLTAAGLDADIAVSSTLMFRILTFWMPTIPGWLAFQNLQRTGDL